MTYSVRQVAERFHVGEHTVLAWVRSGELHAVNVGRNPDGKPHWRITSEALQAFELLRSAQPIESQPRRRRRRDAHVIEFY
jgi:excisionase family DNA binding protein